MSAWACLVTEENMGAIASEYGRGWDLQAALDWLEQHREGFFLRDENNSALDRQFFVPSVFFNMYVFDKGNKEALFRRVLAI